MSDRRKTCPTCKTPFAEVAPDERDAFDLPAIVCTCQLAPCVARLAQEGFVLGDALAARVASAARWPKRYGPVRTALAGQRDNGSRAAPFLMVKPFVAPFIVEALKVMLRTETGMGLPEDQAAAKADFLAAMLRGVTDPEMRAALNAAVRIAGESAIDDVLFAPIRDAAGVMPDTKTSADRMRDAMRRLMRSKAAPPATNGPVF